MSEARLPSHLWVQAQVRRCSAEGMPAYVLRKGEAQGGLVLLKVTIPFQGARLFTQSRMPDGTMGWIAGLNGALAPEDEAGAYIDRQVGRDPDLWVIEVESRTGDNPFEGRVL